MSSDMYYDRNGQPITMMQWAKLFEDRSYAQVAIGEFHGLRVSTIWLGLNHAWDGGKPIIFETMVFVDQIEEIELLGRKFKIHPEVEQYTHRHHTEEEALRYHRQVCDRLMEMFSPGMTPEEFVASETMSAETEDDR